MVIRGKLERLGSQGFGLAVVTLSPVDLRQLCQGLADPAAVGGGGKGAAGILEIVDRQPGFPQAAADVAVLQQQFRMAAQDFVREGDQVAVQQLHPAALDIIRSEDLDHPGGSFPFADSTIVRKGRFHLAGLFVVFSGRIVQHFDLFGLFTLQPGEQEFAK